MSPSPSRTDASAAPADWVAVVAGIMGAFMAALDISVTNASLPQIQGAIGATGTEGTWIASAYLTAEIIMIPLTAWLVRLFGLRRFLLSCSILFTICSILCGFAPSLTQMVAGRIGQGFFGGALIPAAMTIIALKLPPRQQPIGTAMFAGTAILAPVFGPLLGGWLTENAGWQWLFFLNVPIGAVLVVLLLLGLAPERSRLEDLARADWLGIGGLICALGGLTTLLEQGQNERWFESTLIIHLGLVCVFGLFLLFVSQFRAAYPVLQLRLLRDRSFAGVLALSVAMGGAIYTSLYLIPVFLGQVAGDNAEQVGIVAMYSGAGSIAVIPLLPFLSRWLHPRIVIATGLVAFAAACGLDHSMTADTGPSQFFWSQMVRGVGQALTFFPLSQAALTNIAEPDTSDASGLFNMARNLGGSLGLAATGVVFDRRLAFHTQMIAEAVSGNGSRAADRLDRMAAGLAAVSPDAADARLQALRRLGDVLHRQALVMTFSDCFWVFGVALIASVPAVILLRRPMHGASMMHG